jgi:hypothetical protein
MSAFNEPILLLTKLRLPFYDLLTDQFAKRSVVASRRDYIDQFWQSWNAGTVRQDIIDEYGISWIVADRHAKLPATLDPTYANSDFVVYKLHR